MYTVITANMAASERNQSLKEALYENLTAILSPDQHVRLAAENEIKVLELTEEFGVHLTQLTVDTEAAVAQRQLSSVLLKQYVESHWSALADDKFRPPEVTDEAKAEIRRLLPVGLQESLSKVRSGVAYALSAIAHWDWPQAWPELFDILMQALTSDNQHAVHGAMRVLTEFCRQVTDTQMPRLAPVVLQEMYNIFTQDQVYSIRTRGRAIDIFTTLTGLIASMDSCTKGVAKELLYPLLPKFTEAMVAALQVPDGFTSDSGLKMEILKALTVLINNFPAPMSQWTSQVVSPVWSTLVQSADIYIRTVVNATEDADEAVDSDGEVLGFENFVYSVFEFIHAMIESRRFRPALKKAIGDLLYYIILYMQITHDQETLWAQSPDQFVEDEDDDTFSYSVRISAQDLLEAVTQEFPNTALPALVSAVTRHLQESETAKTAGMPHWWKIHEVVMLAVGSEHTALLRMVKNGKLSIDMNMFLQNVVMADLNLTVSAFLTGRALWTASKFSDVMAPELTNSLLQATVTGIHESQSAVIRISAVRAIASLCQHLAQTPQPNQPVNPWVALLKPYLAPLTEGLVCVAMQYGTDVLSLCLDTLVVVLKADPDFTATCEPKVGPLAISILLKYNSDHLIVSSVQELFEVLCNNESCMITLQPRFIPTLVGILTASKEDVALGLQPVALDLLTTLVRSCCTPLSDMIITEAFPVAIRHIMQSDDTSVLQSGGECIRAYVSVALDQLLQWRDDTGNNGVFYVIQATSRLLDPKTSEYTAMFVGRLVSMLITRMGHQLGEDLDLMLRGVLSKMQAVEALSVTQSLVMVFANLIHTQLDAVLEFLCSVPGPDGQPALQFVLTEWCSKQHFFYGSYETKVSIMSLCKLLQHAIESNDSRLQDFEVKGDQVQSESSGMSTRSKTSTAPEEWTNVPVLVKMYKLIINQLSTIIELATAGVRAADDNDDPEEEENEEWENYEDEDDEDEVLEGGYLTDLLQHSAMIDLGETLDSEEIPDPDALKDPLYEVNLHTYLVEFVVTLSRLPCFSMFSAHHTPAETKVLRSIGIR